MLLRQAVAPTTRRYCLHRSLLMIHRQRPPLRTVLTRTVEPSPQEPTLSTGILRSFSAPATANRKIPSNLKIDPRSSFAPKPEPKPTMDLEEQGEAEHDDEKAEKEASTTVKDAHADEEEDDAFVVKDFDNEEEEEDVNADLFLSEQKVLYAKPLPDRLHVDIHTLFAPVHSSMVGTLWLNENVFGREPIRVDLLKRAVLYYRNKLRGRRKAHSKGISDVSGSGRKLRPQKGQGMARVGHSRPAHFRGGAKAHGPSNLTDYGKTKLNKKVRRQALCHALSQRLLEGNLILLDQLHGLPSYKTRELARILKEWNMGGKGKADGASALFIDSYHPEEDSKVTVASHEGIPVPFYLATSNIPRITVGNDHAASVYEILRHDKLVMTLAALEKLESRLKDA